MRDVTHTPALHRRSFLKYTGALGAAAAISSSLSACSSGPESTNDTGGGGERRNGTLTAVIGYGNDGSWDPTQTASAFSMAANNHIYEGLLDTDPISREPYAALATQVPADLTGTSWKFALRAGRHVPRREARHRRRRGLRLRPDPRSEDADARARASSRAG